MPLKSGLPLGSRGMFGVRVCPVRGDSVRTANTAAATPAMTELLTSQRISKPPLRRGLYGYGNSPITPAAPRLRGRRLGDRLDDLAGFARIRQPRGEIRLRHDADNGTVL